jgi:hypothetical protein
MASNKCIVCKEPRSAHLVNTNLFACLRFVGSEIEYVGAEVAKATADSTPMTPEQLAFDRKAMKDGDYV